MALGTNLPRSAQRRHSQPAFVFIMIMKLVSVCVFHGVDDCVSSSFIKEVNFIILMSKCSKKIRGTQFLIVENS
jgi:hypothetical protein